MDHRLKNYLNRKADSENVLQVTAALVEIEDEFLLDLLPGYCGPVYVVPKSSVEIIEELENAGEIAHGKSRWCRVEIQNMSPCTKLERGAAFQVLSWAGQVRPEPISPAGFSNVAAWTWANAENAHGRAGSNIRFGGSYRYSITNRNRDELRVEVSFSGSTDSGGGSFSQSDNVIVPGGSTQVGAGRGEGNACFPDPGSYGFAVTLRLSCTGQSNTMRGKISVA